MSWGSPPPITHLQPTVGPPLLACQRGREKSLAFFWDKDTPLRLLACGATISGRNSFSRILKDRWQTSHFIQAKYENWL